jgi:tRNA A37 threonylcarbamoyladenosine dehydratase
MQPNQYERLITMIGNDGLNFLRNSKILIVGLGGVGGYVVESLSRCGIGTIGLVDYDIVDITNINRQIIATHSTIGRKKTELFKERINDINKDCNVKIYDLHLNEENYIELFKEEYDFIIDCCDTLEVKKKLILETSKRDIEFISSMGTANKMDPSKLEIIDINKTVNDPIARILRKFVRDNKINKKIKVLSSSELPKKNGTKLGSNSFVPPSGGLLIASYVVKRIIDKNLQNN